MSKPADVNEAKFDELVLKAATPVLVDFWAPWCGPCRMVAPIVEELAGEYDGKVAFYKVNTDENQKLAGQYGIMSIPTMIVFKGGKPFASVTGFTSETRQELKKNFDAALAG